MTLRQKKLNLLNKLIYIIPLVISLLLTGCTTPTTSGNSGPVATDNLEITALDVGEADCLLIQAGANTILVDTGLKKSAEKILNVLHDKKISELDYLIITHYDKDHVGAASKVLEKVSANQILCPGYTGTRDEYIAFRMIAKDRVELNTKETYTCGDLKFTIYPASNPAPLIAAHEDYDNDLSLVMLLEYGSKSFLFTGDIEKERISQMIEANELSSCDWIKIPHHGRYQKKLSDLLDVVSPAYAVISTSADKEPEENLIDLLNSLDVTFSCTTDGDVVTYSDGEKIWFKE